MTSAKQVPSNFSLTGLIRMARVSNLLIVALAQYMTAIFLIGSADYWDYLLDVKLFLLCLATIVLTASGYIINDYYDIKIDYINKPDKVVVGKLLKRRVVMVIHTILNIIGVLLGLLVSYQIGLICLGASFLLWLYSNQLKRLPFVGNLAVGLLTSLAILLVDLYYESGERLVLTYAIFALFITLIREIIKDIEDMRGDMRHGCLTLPIKYGIRKTKNIIYWLSFGFVLTLIIVTISTSNVYLMSYFGLLGVPFVWFLYKLNRSDKKRDFTHLSRYCKWLMLVGIISMVFL